MVIMGIDPGIAIMGYGFIEVKGNKITPLDYGAVTTPANMSVSKRLEIIYEGLKFLMEKYNPEAVAFEELFYYNNQKTIIPVAEARGIALMVANQNCGNLFEYTPLQIKQALTGNGRAEKKQVQ